MHTDNGFLINCPEFGSCLCYYLQMGLDFTRISDQQGPGIYMIHNGTVTQARAVEGLAKELSNRQKAKQVVVLSACDHDTQQILDFYDLSISACPHILVVADDDQVLYSWSGSHLPTIDHISYAVSSL